MVDETLKNVDKELKRRKIRTKLDDGIVHAANWIDNHKEEIAKVASASAMITPIVLKSIKVINSTKEAHRKAYSFYDHSMQKSVKLTKNLNRLTKAEEAEIRIRHENGEKYYDIYKSMGFVK